MPSHPSPPSPSPSSSLPPPSPSSSLPPPLGVSKSKPLGPEKKPSTDSVRLSKRGLVSKSMEGRSLPLGPYLLWKPRLLTQGLNILLRMSILTATWNVRCRFLLLSPLCLLYPLCAKDGFNGEKTDNFGSGEEDESECESLQVDCARSQSNGEDSNGSECNVQVLSVGGSNLAEAD